MKLLELPDYLADYYAARAQFPQAEVLLMDLGNGAECMVVTDEEGAVPFAPTSGEREAFVLQREARIGTEFRYFGEWFCAAPNGAPVTHASLAIAITRAYLAAKYGAEYDYADVPVDDSQKPLPDDGSIAATYGFSVEAIMLAAERPVAPDADGLASQWQYTMGPGNHLIDFGEPADRDAARGAMQGWLDDQMVKGGRFVPKAG